MIPEPKIIHYEDEPDEIEQDEWRYWKCLKCGEKWPETRFHNIRYPYIKCRKCGSIAYGSKEFFKKFEWVEETEDEEDE